MIRLTIDLLLLVGSAFMLLAALGVYRFPDVLIRMHAVTKAATLGVVCTLGAVAVHFAELGTGVRAVLVIVFLFLTAPVSAYVITRAAYLLEVPLWHGSVRDDLRQARLAEKPGSAGSGS